MALSKKADGDAAGISITAWAADSFGAASVIFEHPIPTSP